MRPMIPASESGCGASSRAHAVPRSEGQSRPAGGGRLGRAIFRAERSRGRSNVGSLAPPTRRENSSRITPHSSPPSDLQTEGRSALPRGWGVAEANSPLQPVVGYRLVLPGVCPHEQAPGQQGAETGLAQQAGETLVAAEETLLLKLRVDARRAVGLLALRKERSDPLGPARMGLLSWAGGSLAPGLVGHLSRVRTKSVRVRTCFL
jgi:hypothetical protein